MDEPPDPLPDVFAVVFEERDPGLQFKYDLGKKCCVVSGFSRNDKGQPMEAEWRGSIPLGSSILSVAAKPTDDCTEEQLRRVFEMSPRPVRVILRLPTSEPIKDSFGFVRDTAYVEKETAFRAASLRSVEKSNFKWISFIKEMKGGAGGGNESPLLMGSGGSPVSCLRRDAFGHLFTSSPSGLSSSPSVPSPISVIRAHKRCWVGSDASSQLGAESPVPSSPRAAAAVGGRPTLAQLCERPDSVDSDGTGSQQGTPVPLSSPALFPSSLPPPVEASASPFLGVRSTAGRPQVQRANSDSATAGVGPPKRLSLSLSLPSMPWKSGSNGNSNGRNNAAVKQLEGLILSGIPPAFRASVWYEVSGAAAKASLFPPGFYTSLVDSGAPPSVAGDIEKDLDRTFPGHSFFEHTSNLTALRRLLTGFAVRNPEIGYCQSINFVAGMLLLHMSEEESFWVMDVLVNEILPPAYYCDSLKGLHADQKVLQHLLSRFLPSVSACLTENKIDLSLISLEWFMCQFCTSLPTHCALRVWDCLFLYGSQVLFRFALALFHMNAPLILAAKDDFGQLFNVLQRKLPDVHDAELLIKCAFPSTSALSLGPKLPWFGMTNELLVDLRRQALDNVSKQLDEVAALRLSFSSTALLAESTEVTVFDDTAVDAAVAADGSGTPTSSVRMGVDASEAATAVEAVDSPPQAAIPLLPLEEAGEDMMEL